MRRKPMLLPEIKKIVKKSRTVAVVGLSPKTIRPSYQVADYLMGAGYDIIPVNPGQSEILGRVCYPDLRAVPVKIDIVDIFRRAEDVLPVVRDAIAVGASLIWMQQGVVNQEAADLAQEAGIPVVMDRCLKVEHLNMAG